MQTTKRSAMLATGLVVLVGLTSVAQEASAVSVTRWFEFSSSSGPLTFGPNVGSFTYDDSVAPPGGGYVFAVGLFSDLAVSFGGFSFDESTANSGGIQFDAGGGLREALFGNNCSAADCQIADGSQHWWIRVGVPETVNDFAYSGYAGATDFYQTFGNTLLPVPEPGSFALMGLGLAAVAWALRRR